MSDSVVTLSKSGAVGTILLDRPPANSYEITFMQALNAAIDAAEADDGVKVIILRSASAKFFSAGADIKAFMANSSADNMAMIDFAHQTEKKIAASDKIYIAAIKGHALGGGLEMALSCDLRFAAEGRYYLGLPEVTLGLLPGNGGTQRLSRLIGPNKAICITFRVIAAAVKIGFSVSTGKELMPSTRLLISLVAVTSSASLNSIALTVHCPSVAIP